ncbi:protease 2 [Citrobacter braakii]|nr:protease 2 [Citrobacter braakii]
MAWGERRRNVNGVAINERPELFHGVIAQVPFVDVVTTMLDESIPLTTGEFEEWGNPQDEEYYTYMKSYSPYDNVTAQDYPHLLVTDGITRLPGAILGTGKMGGKTARAENGRSSAVTLHGYGFRHGGKSGRFKSYEGVALEYAFLIGLAQGTLPGQASAQALSR